MCRMLGGGDFFDAMRSRALLLQVFVPRLLFPVVATVAMAAILNSLNPEVFGTGSDVCRLPSRQTGFVERPRTAMPDASIMLVPRPT